MDLRKLKTLIDLVSESNVSELEITEAEGKVRIVKGGGAVTHHYAPPPVATMSPAAVAAINVESITPVAAIMGHVVKSPMVGTFTARPHRAPKSLSRSVMPLRKARPSALLKP